MSQWNGSDRRSRLPENWDKTRKRILRRDGYRCTSPNPDTGERCAEPATDVDHIQPGDDHRDSNLRALCGWHHQKKSSHEGGQASRAQWARNNRKFRRTESHPGSID